MKLLLLCIGFISVISCSNKGEIPSGIISKQEMKLLLWDLAKADEWVNTRRQKDSALNVKAASFSTYEQVFSIHKVSRENFYQSYKYYADHPDLLKALMDSVSALATQKSKLPSAAIKPQ
jgi:hypothetical protein